MKKLLYILLIPLLVVSLLIPALGQNEGLEETLLDMVENNAEGYLGPLVTAFGTGLNSGTFHNAKPHAILGFDITLNATITAIPESALEYEFYLPDDLLALTVSNPLGGDLDINVALSDIYYTGQKVPTFFGSSDPSRIEVDTDKAYDTIIDEITSATGLAESVVEASVGSDVSNLVNSSIQPLPGPSGIDFPAWPTIMPQLAIGLPLGTEIMFRGFAAETPDGDPISFNGFGAKISLSQFIPVPAFPVGISAGIYGNKVNLADIVKADNSIFTLQASFSVPVITIYGGLGFESSDMSVSVKDENDDLLYKFNLEGENQTRTTIGFRLKLAVLSFHADYNAGAYESYTAGIGLTLR